MLIHDTNFPDRLMTSTRFRMPDATAFNGWTRAKWRMYAGGMTPQNIMRFRNVNMNWAGTIPLFTMPINQIDPHRNSDEVIELCAFEELFGAKLEFASNIYVPDRFMYRDTQTKRLGMILNQRAIDRINDMCREDIPEMVPGYPGGHYVARVGSTDILCFVYLTNLDEIPF